MWRLIFFFPLAAFAAQNIPNWPANNMPGTTTFAFSPQSSADVSSLIGTNKPVGIRYYLAPGIYNCYSPMQVPTNGAIIGAGAGATTIINWVTNSTPLFSMSDGGTLGNLTISNVWTVAPGNASFSYPAQAQFCWGIGNGSAPANGALNIGLIGIGETDVEFVDCATPCSWTDVSCSFTSHWDTVAIKNGAHLADYFGCIFKSRTNAYASANNRCSIFNNQSFAGRVRVFNSYMELLDADAYIVRGASGAIGYEFYGCTQTNFTSGHALMDILAGTRLKMDSISSRGISPLLINEDVGSESKVDWGTNVVRAIAFGGSQDDGLGPVLAGDFPTSRRLLLTNGYIVPKAYYFITNWIAVASGFTPDISRSMELITTNDAMVFGLMVGTPVNEYFEHICIVSNTGAADKPIVFPPPYATNLAGTISRCTNRSKVTISGQFNRYTNAFVQPQQ